MLVKIPWEMINFTMTTLIISNFSFLVHLSGQTAKENNSD